MVKNTIKSAEKKTAATKFCVGDISLFAEVDPENGKFYVYVKGRDGIHYDIVEIKKTNDETSDELVAKCYQPAELDVEAEAEVRISVEDIRAL